MLLSCSSSLEQNNMELVFSPAPYIPRQLLLPDINLSAAQLNFGFCDGFFPLLQSTVTTKGVSCVPCSFKRPLKVTYSNKCGLERHSFGSTLSPIRPGSFSCFLTFSISLHVQLTAKQCLHALDILRVVALSK